MLLATPRTSDANGGGQHGDGGLDLRTQIAALANPDSLRLEGRHDRGGAEELGSGERGSVDRQGVGVAVALLTDVAAKDTFGRYAAAIERWATILCRPAPAPLVDDKLNPQFVEWMMGLPQGWVTDCGLPRSRQLHVLGNGVVPQQAAHAIGQLFARHDDARPMEQAA